MAPRKSKAQKAEEAEEAAAKEMESEGAPVFEAPFDADDEPEEAESNHPFSEVPFREVPLG